MRTIDNYDVNKHYSNSNSRVTIPPLIQAVENNNLEIVKYLLEQKADVDDPIGGTRYTAVMEAAALENLELLEIFGI